MMSDSFEEIFETLSPRLSAQLDALGFQGCAAEREDLLQEIRIRIWKTFKNGRRGISNVNAYIKKIVYSVFINEMSRQKRDRQLVCLAGEAFISHTNNCSEGFFIHALQIDEIRNCIRGPQAGNAPSGRAVLGRHEARGDSPPVRVVVSKNLPQVLSGCQGVKKTFARKGDSM